MNERYGQMSIALGVLPLTVAAFALAGPSGVPVIWPFREDLQVSSALSTLVFALGLVFAWRRFVTWTRGRVGVTVGLGVLAFGQILFWRPMWHSEGCAEDDILRCAQSMTDGGLWCAGCVLTWWGARTRRRAKRAGGVVRGRFVMTPSAMRIAVGFGLMPLLPGVFFIVLEAMDHFWSAGNAVQQAVGYEVCALIAIGAWLWIWKGRVRWTGQRRARTGALCGVLAVAALAPLVPSSNVPMVNPIVSVVPLLGLAAWFAGTGWAWRMDDAELVDDVSARATCDRCQYDLRGLREVRCPECGWTATLDVLVQRCLARARLSED